MERILLVTDGASDLTPEDIAGKPITIVPATVLFGGKEYKEFYDLRPSDFWDVLEQYEEIPVTQQASPLDFLECYKSAYKSGYTHLLVSVISSTASGAMSSAVLARGMLEEEPEFCGKLTIEVIDSLGYSMMYGHMILEAARQVGEGRSFDEIVSDYRDRVSRCEALFLVYSLKHIRKSGRISGMSAFMGEAMGIRPILYAVDGHIEPVDKVRGEKKIIPRMIELFKERCVDPSGQNLYLVSSKIAPEEVDRAEAELRENFRPLDVVHGAIGCSVSANTGPYCMAIIYYGAKRDQSL